MRIRLGCLHAHYSNIDFIEKAFSPFEMELVHFVDPALMYRMTYDEKFLEAEARKKVKEQIEWIAQTNVDAILITCTNYIALLQEEKFTIPIIKIDEPYFESICQLDEPLIIFFTNPATVERSVARLRDYADNQQKSINIEEIVINHTFELIMQGRKEEYDQEISKFLLNTLKEKKKMISVAQLSMVDAAEQIADATATNIIHPLNSLVTYVERLLELKRING